MADDKIICIISGCCRGMLKTTARKRWGHDNISLICGKHWRRLSKAERAVWRRIERQRRKFGVDNLGPRENRIWTALKRRAA